MRATATAIQWTSPNEGMLNGMAVTLSGNNRISFDWQQPGTEGRYDLIQALQIRGVHLEPLGCPQYPMASMGQEKVMIVSAPGRAPFVMTVYGRSAPTGTEYALYEVDVDFSGIIPDQTALTTGRYPGGGGRAFAVDASGWITTCPDPVS